MLRLFGHYLRRGYGPRIAWRLARARRREGHAMTAAHVAHQHAFDLQPARHDDGQ